MVPGSCAKLKKYHFFSQSTNSLTSSSNQIIFWKHHTFCNSYVHWQIFSTLLNIWIEWIFLLEEKLCFSFRRTQVIKLDGWKNACEVFIFTIFWQISFWVDIFRWISTEYKLLKVFSMEIDQNNTCYQFPFFNSLEWVFWHVSKDNIFDNIFFKLMMVSFWESELRDAGSFFFYISSERESKLRKKSCVSSLGMLCGVYF